MPDEETVRSIDESFAERQAIFDEIDQMKMNGRGAQPQMAA